MDERVTAVLESYHERIREEHEGRREGPPPGGAEDWRDRALLAVGPETGQLINILARSLKAPKILELGTSYGYSGIWLAEAARATSGRLTTIELQSYKSAYALEMSIKAGLADHVDFKVGDALNMIANCRSSWISCWSIFGRTSTRHALTRFIPSSTRER
jgi:predicted O-methyltransferase YrrM